MLPQDLQPDMALPIRMLDFAGFSDLDAESVDSLSPSAHGCMGGDVR